MDDRKVIEKLVELMFPPLHSKKEDGEQWYVDFSIDSNLLSAHTDILLNQVDDVTLGTIKEILERLSSARKLLNPYIKNNINESGNVLIAPMIIS